MQFVNIVKPTHICNLDCTYCYNDDVRDQVMRPETLRRTVEHHRALVAEVDLHALAWHPCLALLHLGDELLLGHDLRSPLRRD